MRQKKSHVPPDDTGYWRKTHVASGVAVKMLVRKVPGGARKFEATFVGDQGYRWYPVSQYPSKLWFWEQV